MQWHNEVMKFLILLVCGGNPANGRVHSPWRVEIAEKFLHYLQDNSLYWAWRTLVRWASVEWFNKGSIMRATCPLSLKGTGRWHANDGGGRYKVLLNLVINALEDPVKYPVVALKFLATIVELDPTDFESVGNEETRALLERYLQLANVEEEEDPIEVEEPLVQGERLEEWE